MNRVLAKVMKIRKKTYKQGKYVKEREQIVRSRVFTGNSVIRASSFKEKSDRRGIGRVDRGKVLQDLVCYAKKLCMMYHQSVKAMLCCDYK